MASPNGSPIPTYDPELGMAELTAYRETADSHPVAREIVILADKMAPRMATCFPDPALREAAGLALIIAAATFSKLASDEVVTPGQIMTLVGVTGHALVTEVRRG
jgi:hypothetical protein